MNFPGLIHYCWFGGKPLPSKTRKYIETWKKFMPNYEIKCWDETNFDVTQCEYSNEAYKKGKYAFVSDYARFKVLFENGGLYFDTDVELIKSLENIISHAPFLAREYDSFSSKPMVATGLGMGVYPGDMLCHRMIEFYESLTYSEHKKNEEWFTVLKPVSDFFYDRGLRPSPLPTVVDGYTIYPPEYFSPMNPWTRETVITPLTVAIHHYEASWQPRIEQIKKRIKKFIGPRLTALVIEHKKKSNIKK